MAFPVVEGTSYGYTWSSYAWSLTYGTQTGPTGNVGDRELLWIADTQTYAYYYPTAPTGWTLVGHCTNTGTWELTGHLYQRTATSTAGHSWTFTTGSSYNPGQHISSYNHIRISGTPSGSAFSDWAVHRINTLTSRYDNGNLYGATNGCNLGAAEDAMWIAFAKSDNGGSGISGASFGNGWGQGGTFGVTYAERYNANQQYHTTQWWPNWSDWHGTALVAVKGPPPVTATASITGTSLAISGATHDVIIPGGGWGTVMI